MMDIHEPIRYEIHRFPEKFIKSEFPINGNLIIDDKEWLWVSSSMTPESSPWYINKFVVEGEQS